jgi:hypothetical protein
VRCYSYGCHEKDVFVSAASMHGDLSCAGRTVETTKNQNGDSQDDDKPKRRQSKRRHVGTTTNQNGDNNFRSTPDNQNVDKPKRRHAETTTGQNGDNNCHTTSDTSDNKNDDTPKQRQAIEAKTVTVKTTKNQSGIYNFQTVALIKRITPN